jgi:hypothetical protein
VTDHTPGPWIIDEQYIVADDDKVICQWGSYSEEANAHLIAAAPDMLIVLKYAQIILKNRDQDFNETKVLNAIKAVIAQAEGRDE